MFDNLTDQLLSVFLRPSTSNTPSDCPSGSPLSTRSLERSLGRPTALSMPSPLPLLSDISFQETSPGLFWSDGGSHSSASSSPASSGAPKASVEVGTQLSSLVWDGTSAGRSASTLRERVSEEQRTRMGRRSSTTTTAGTAARLTLGTLPILRRTRTRSRALPALVLKRATASRPCR